MELIDYDLDSFHAIRNFADSAFDNCFTPMVENPIVDYKLESGMVVGPLILPLASEQLLQSLLGFFDLRIHGTQGERLHFRAMLRQFDCLCDPFERIESGLKQLEFRMEVDQTYLHHLVTKNILITMSIR